MRSTFSILILCLPYCFSYEVRSLCQKHYKFYINRREYNVWFVTIPSMTLHIKTESDELMKVIRFRDLSNRYYLKRKILINYLFRKTVRGEGWCRSSFCLGHTER